MWILIIFLFPTVNFNAYLVVFALILLSFQIPIIGILAVHDCTSKIINFQVLKNPNFKRILLCDQRVKKKFHIIEWKIYLIKQKKKSFDMTLDTNFNVHISVLICFVVKVLYSLLSQNYLTHRLKVMSSWTFISLCFSQWWPV